MPVLVCFRLSLKDVDRVEISRLEMIQIRCVPSLCTALCHWPLSFLLPRTGCWWLAWWMSLWQHRVIHHRKEIGWWRGEVILYQFIISPFTPISCLSFSTTITDCELGRKHTSTRVLWMSELKTEKKKNKKDRLRITKAHIHIYRIFHS